MLQVRFHGRGGHGIKTASRILGTAAFLSGLQAQDSPVYGAERRGAALTAFTRIGPEPIRERGAVTCPDLILLADDTLLTDASAGVRTGIEYAHVLFINSPHEGPSLQSQHAISCPVVSLDLTELTSSLLGRGFALSAALGGVACALARLSPLDLVIQAVRQELSDLHVTAEQIDANSEVTRRAYDSILATSFTVTSPCGEEHRPIRQEAATMGSDPVRPLLPERPEGCFAQKGSDRSDPIFAAGDRDTMHSPVYLSGPEGVPVISATGNSAVRHTGLWRLFRPVIDREVCTRCGICFAVCPDGAIAFDGNGFPMIDYDNCKGCMICHQECPVHCIAETKEVRAW